MRPLRLMTFNVRFDTILDADAGNRWTERVASVVETVRRFDPDVVGFQEALRPQLHDLIAALPEHVAVGRPREAGDVGEYVPIFGHRQRLRLLEFGDFWLSDTPEISGSLGWDAHDPRHCTWASFVGPWDDGSFVVFNTHLDRWGALARLEAAKLIVKRIELAGRLPTIVMGDLNAEEGSVVLATLHRAGFRDTFRDAESGATDVQTVHHYREHSGDRKIDYVLCDERWRVLRAGIIREPAAGRLPSDHYPVVAEVLPAPRRTSDRFQTVAAGKMQGRS